MISEQIKNTRILQIIKNYNSTKFLKIIILGLIVAVLEIAGIGLIIPLILILLDTQKEYYLFGYNFIEKIGPDLLLILIVIFFIFKNFLIMINSIYLNNYMAKFRSTISYKIFSNSLDKKYLDDIDDNSSEIIQTAIEDTNVFINFSLRGLIGIIQEALIFFGIFLFLFFLIPHVTIYITIIIFGLSLIFIILTKNRSNVYGKLKRDNDERRLFNLSQSLSSLREIKFFNIEKFVLTNYSKFNSLSAKYFSRMNTFILFPKIYFETLAIVLIILIIYYAKTLGIDNQIIIQNLAIFFVAALKVLPSINKIIVHYHQLKFGDTAVSKIYNNLGIITKKIDKFSFQENKVDLETNLFETLEIEDLKFRFKKSNKLILENLNLRIDKGEFIMIKGVSGSGKTTLISIILGLLKPTSGVIKLNRNNISLKNYNLSKIFAYIPQSIFIINDTFENNILFGREKVIDHKEHIKSLSKIFKLAELESINILLKENGANLSGGQKQRLGFVRAMYNKPKILILDEATNAMDTELERNIFSSLKNEFDDLTIICISHDTKNEKYADKIFEIKK